MVINFLTVNCLSTFNRVLGRPLLRALKAVTSIHYLTMKFPTAAGTSQVQGRQRDSRECYSRSIELAEKGLELPQAIEVEKISQGPMETNIDTCLQEDESTTGPVEELTEIKVDPNEPSYVVKIGKGLKKELAQQFTKFLSLNQDVFAWTHADMVGIYLEVMCHQLNIDPQAKPVPQKRRVLDADHYKALQDEVDRFLKIVFIRESYYID